MVSKNVGSDNPKWKGGTRNYWAKKLKKDIGHCEVCYGIRLLEIHHKDCNESNNERNNLILLCRLCHRTIAHHGKRGVTKGMKFSGKICKNGKLHGTHYSYKKKEFIKKISEKRKEYFNKLKELEEGAEK